MLAICRTLFFVVILFCLIFVGRDYQSINISTDLNDLSPSLSQDALTQRAIDKLSNDIESRFLIIITGDNKEKVNNARLFFEKRIAKLNTISIDQPSIDKLLDELKAYRFQLLSSQQRNLIDKNSTESLTQEAQRLLFRMDSGLQLLPVSEDPLATFSHFADELINKQFTRRDEIGRIDKGGEPVFFSPFSLRLNTEAMNIESQKNVLSTMDALESEINQKFESQLLRSGVFFFAADAAEKSEKDIKFISTLSTIGILLLLVIIFRSIKTLILPALSIAIGIVFAVGVSHYLYNSIHILTIVFGASLIGIIIDYSLHYFYHQQITTSSPEQNKVNSREHKKVNSHEQDKINSHELNKINGNDHDRENRIKLYRALLLSVITSLVGYSALSFSSLEALQKVAIFSCCGIFAAWLSVITVGSLSRIQGITTNDYWLSKTLSTINAGLYFIANKINFFIWALIFLMGVIALTLTGLPTNDNPRLFFKPSAELLNQETQANQFSQDFEPGRYILIKGKTVSDIYMYYEALYQLLGSSIINANDSTKIDKTPFFSAMDILPSPEKQKMDYKIQEKIYQENGVVEQFFNILGLPKEQALKLQKAYRNHNTLPLDPSQFFSTQNNLPPIWLKQENEHIAFVLIKKNIDANKIESLLNQSNIDADHIRFINSLALSEQALKEQRGSASLLLLLAYALIAFLMLLYYRQLNALWVLLVPLSATLVTLGLFTLLAIDITLFHVMGLFLVLGLGMDYVIFIREMDEHNAITQNAIFLSTLTTLFSFGLLSISSIPVAQAFGISLLFGNSLNFLFSLFYAQLAKRNLILT